jgi:hypothetical protein
VGPMRPSPSWTRLRSPVYEGGTGRLSTLHDYGGGGGYHTLGPGRIIALHDRASTSHQIR